MTVVLTYGGGTNSAALVLTMLAKGEPAPDAILFADTGNEKPHTYQYIKMMSAYLVDRGYPTITVLRRARRDRTWKTLEDDCLRLGVLPSVAYGWKTCSQKFKIEPQDKWMNNSPICKSAWAKGELVTKIVGFDFGEIKRARFGKDNKYVLRYPLIEWEMNRAACIAAILLAGLPLPGKSACFFCPHTKKQEIFDLAAQYPDLAKRALALEENAASGLRKVKGLGRSFAWNDLLRNENLDVVEDPFDEEPCGCYDG